MAGNDAIMDGNHAVLKDAPIQNKTTACGNTEGETVVAIDAIVGGDCAVMKERNRVETELPFAATAVDENAVAVDVTMKGDRDQCRL